MIWKRTKTIFAWLLMALGVVGFIGIAAHFLVPGVSGPHISSSSSPWFENGFTVDCATWWGTLTHLVISLCAFAWGWGIVHDMKEGNPNINPKTVFQKAANGLLKTVRSAFGTMKITKSGCLKSVVIALALLVVAALAIRGYYVHKFPYGCRHLCIKGIGMSLKMYAADHGGRFPSGMETPEASLGLLYPKYMPSAEVLGGKTVQSGVAEALLANGCSRLTPEACAWHYVEGLTEDDSPSLAILWDKLPGYGHNCDLIPDRNGREVLFVDGHAEWIPGADWEQLMAWQTEMMAARETNQIPNKPSGGDS